MSETLPSNWEFAINDLKRAVVLCLVWYLRSVLLMSYVAVAAISHMKCLRDLNSRLISLLLDSLNHHTHEGFINGWFLFSLNIFIGTLKSFHRISLIMDKTRRIQHLLRRGSLWLLLLLLSKHHLQTTWCLVPDSCYVGAEVWMSTFMSCRACCFL